jgi:predicted nuclease with TOPRIM domain
MTDEVGNLILEWLRRIDEKLDRLGHQVRECRERLGHLEEMYSSLSRRVDRMDDRLDRIERRFELQEAK